MEPRYTQIVYANQDWFPTYRGVSPEYFDIKREIMELFQGLNERGLTIVLVTHEHDIAQFAKRVIVFRDGSIRRDEQVRDRRRAREVLETMQRLED